MLTRTELGDLSLGPQNNGLFALTEEGMVQTRGPGLDLEPSSLPQDLWAPASAVRVLQT